MEWYIAMWAFIGVSLFIDVFTLVFFLFVKKKPNIIDTSNIKVSAIVPIHAEKVKDVLKTVKSLYDEDFPVHKVIVCGDSSSSEVASKIHSLSRKYPSLSYVQSPANSKATKITHVAHNVADLGDFLYVRDCRVTSQSDCIQKMVDSYDDSSIAAITSYGTLQKPEGFLARSYYYGKSWINELGRFRKNAQQKRKAVFVVCGASTMYRLDILRKIPVPHGSKTEDTHYTWVLQNKGYRIRVVNNAIVSAPDVDGKLFTGLKNQMKQAYRWNSGTIQCFFLEGKSLMANKRLSYSTIIPGFAEALMYSTPLVFLPALLYFFPAFGLGFIIGDTFFSLLGTLVVTPKRFFHTIFHYPQIFFYKYFSSLTFLSALAVTCFQAAAGKQGKWSNEWTPLQTK